MTAVLAVRAEPTEPTEPTARTARAARAAHTEPTADVNGLSLLQLFLELCKQLISRAFQQLFLQHDLAPHSRPWLYKASQSNLAHQLAKVILPGLKACELEALSFAL